MRLKYKRAAAAVLAAVTLSGCAGRQTEEKLQSGDAPAGTTPAVTSVFVEETAPETTPAAPETTAPITTSGPESVTTATETGEGYTVYDRSETRYSTDTVNIRELPSTESKVVGQFNPGDEANVTGYTSTGWLRISYNGATAYVFGEYFSEIKPELPEQDVVIPEGYYFSSPSDYFFIVNKENFLPEDYAIETDFVQGSYELEIVAAKHCKDMIAAAEKDGIDLKVLSAYRTVDYQKKLFERNVNSRMEDDGMTYDEAYYDVSINIAPPGGSEHNAGLAVDIIDRNHWDTYTAFEDTKEFEWLYAHCAEYGFILRYLKGKEDITGYIYEPWHYRYVGTEYASAVMASGLCLEEYIGQNMT